MKDEIYAVLYVSGENAYAFIGWDETEELAKAVAEQDAIRDGFDGIDWMASDVTSMPYKQGVRWHGNTFPDALKYPYGSSYEIHVSRKGKRD